MITIITNGDSDKPHVEHLETSDATELVGAVFIQSSTTLENLVRIDGNLVVAFESYFPKLTEITGEFTSSECYVNMPKLQSIGKLELYENMRMFAPELDYIDRLDVHCGTLMRIHRVGQLVISASQRISMPNLSEVEHLSLVDTGYDPNVSLPSLRKVKFLYLSDRTQLPLEEVECVLVCDSGASLPRLKHADTLILNGNIDAPELLNVNEVYIFNECRIRAPKLQSVNVFHVEGARLGFDRLLSTKLNGYELRQGQSEPLSVDEIAERIGKLDCVEKWRHVAFGTLNRLPTA